MTKDQEVKFKILKKKCVQYSFLGKLRLVKKIVTAGLFCKKITVLGYRIQHKNMSFSCFLGS